MIAVAADAALLASDPPTPYTGPHPTMQLILPARDVQTAWPLARWHMDKSSDRRTRPVYREQQLLVREQRRPPVALVALVAGSAVAQPLRRRQIHGLRDVEA